MTKTVRIWRLRLAGLLGVLGLLGAAALVVPTAPKAEAAYWCVSTGTTFVPLMSNIGGSTSRNPVRVKVGGTWHDLWKGQPKRLCPTAFWVHFSRDHLINFENGYGVIGHAYGEHSFGGVNCLARRLGGSDWMKFDEYWQ